MNSAVSVGFSVPRRPYEVILPSELLYEIVFNCSDAALVSEVRAAVHDYLKARINLEGTCSATPTGCIVDNVIASCVGRRRRRQPGTATGGGSDRPRQRRARRRKRRRRRSRTPSDAARSRRRRRRRRHHERKSTRRHHGGPAESVETPRRHGTSPASASPSPKSSRRHSPSPSLATSPSLDRKSARRHQSRPTATSTATVSNKSSRRHRAAPCPATPVKSPRRHSPSVSPSTSLDRKSSLRQSLAASSTTSSLLAVQFRLATRLLGSDSAPWPDDYHRAVYWLRTVYDDVEHQLSSGNFRLAEREISLTGLVTEVDDSLTEAPLETVCEIGYQFNSNILLCGMASFSRTVFELPVLGGLTV